MIPKASASRSPARLRRDRQRVLRRDRRPPPNRALYARAGTSSAQGSRRSVGEGTIEWARKRAHSRLRGEGLPFAEPFCVGVHRWGAAEVEQQHPVSVMEPCSVHELDQPRECFALVDRIGDDSLRPREPADSVDCFGSGEAVWARVGCDHLDVTRFDGAGESELVEGRLRESANPLGLLVGSSSSLTPITCGRCRRLRRSRRGARPACCCSRCSGRRSRT